MQHATINLPSSSPLRAMTGLAKQIALPAEYAPERYPSYPALERTAVMGFNQPASLNLPASTATKLMLTRQPTFPLWADQAFLGQSYQVAWPCSYNTSILSMTIAEFVVGDTVSNWNTGNATASTTRLGVAGANSSYKYAPIAIDNTVGHRPWVYLPAGTNNNLVFQVGSSAAFGNGTNFTVTYEVWSAPGESGIGGQATGLILGTNYGGISGFITATGSGAWIRPISVSIAAAAPENIGTLQVTAVVTCGGTMTYAVSMANQGVITVTPAASTAFYFVTEPSEFVNSQLPWFSTRLTAVALLATNVTQVLNKSGTVLAGRVSPQVQSPWDVTYSYVNTLHPAEKSWLPLETGFYTYCPPSTDLADFWDYTLGSRGDPIFGSANACPVYRLDNTSLVNIAFFTPGSIAEAMALTVSYHIEFRTSSALFTIALSGLQLETFHQAQLSLAAAGFFFENPSHSSVLRKVISGIHDIMPGAIKMLRIASPTAGRIAAATYRAITNKKKKQKGGRRGKQPAPGKRSVKLPESRPNMPPTSAQKSGIVAPKRRSGLDMYLESRR